MTETTIEREIKTVINLDCRTNISMHLRQLLLENSEQPDIIPDTNFFKLNPIDQLKNFDESDDKQSKDLYDYISFSAIAHCIDAWSYVREAIAAYINGQEEICMHLIYYSELRVLMSLLSSFGIGVFNNKHIYINSSNRPQEFSFNPRKGSKSRGLGTHEFVNQITDILVKECPERLMSIMPYGTSNVYDSIRLDDKFGGIPKTISETMGDVETDLLSHFFSLKRDQISRNESSYRPSLTCKNLDVCKEDFRFVIQLWSLCNPENFANINPGIGQDFYTYIYKRLEKTIDTDSKTNYDPTTERFLSKIGVSNAFKTAFLNEKNIKTILTKIVFLNMICNMNCIDMIGKSVAPKLQNFVKGKAKQHNLRLIDLAENPQDIWTSDITDLLNELEEMIKGDMPEDSLLNYLLSNQESSALIQANNLLSYHLLTNFEYSWAWGLISK